MALVFAFMAENQAVTLEDVRRVAELANLELTSDEESRMLRDLGAILGHVQQLNAMDTAAVEPLAQIAELLTGVEGRATALRADEICPSLDREPVLASATSADSTYFKVPKVIER
jgi:aspartyl-tRNA(Asn)/glutamyl-tRNA(Gln) amidotransferase subunit C